MAKAHDLTQIPGEVKKTRAEKKVINKAEYADIKAAEGEIINPPITTPKGHLPGTFGRPTTYNDDIASEICAHLAMGKSLNKTLQQANLPSMATVFNWLQAYPDFLEKYNRAKAESADAMAEQLLDIADDTDEYTEVMTLSDGTTTTRRVDNTRRSQLRIETRKWLMAKTQPRKYGDKLDLTSGGDKLPTPLLSGLSNASDDIKDLPETTE